METKKIISAIDHTQLKAYCKGEDIDKLCEEALKYGTASVCIPPCYVKYAREKFGNTLNICTVIGFPLGYETTEVKAFEASDAIKNGADEIDMVINVSAVKNGDFELVRNDISAVREACDGKILKVIIECCYLDEIEKAELCKIVSECKADFIKTSTGFGSGGAKLEDIELFKRYIDKTVRIKAAGGIRTREAAEAFLNAGCTRIGTSSLEAIKNKE